MPSQVVILPRHIIQAIDTLAWFHKAHAFGLHGLEVIAGGPEEPVEAFRVHAGVTDATRHNPFVDSVYVVLIQADGVNVPPPRHLPQAEALDLLQSVEAALLALQGLSAHEQAEILSACSHARLAAATPRNPRTRSPRTEYERNLLSRAAALQQIAQPAFGGLTRKLKGYRQHLNKSRVEIGIARLDMQAELGALLCLRQDDKKFVATLSSPSRRGDLSQLARSAHNQLQVLQDIGEAVHRADNFGRNWLDVARLHVFHTRLVSSVPGSGQAGRLRQHPMSIRSPFDGTIRPVEQPADSLADAFAAFVDAFDIALWRDIHPLIRAALMHTEFVRLHPYADANGRLARMSMLGALLEAGYPVLPLHTVIEWNRHIYLHRVDRAVVMGDDLGWLQFLLKAVDKAMALGRIFSTALIEELPHLKQAITAQWDSPKAMHRFAVQAATSVLGPDPQMARWGFHALDCERRYLRSQQLDCVDAEDIDIGVLIAERSSPVLWSHPIARYLLARPLARL